MHVSALSRGKNYDKGLNQLLPIWKEIHPLKQLPKCTMIQRKHCGCLYSPGPIALTMHKNIVAMQMVIAVQFCAFET